MKTQIETISKKINTYEEYLSNFLPKLVQTQNKSTLTPEEIGVKMAEETLTHIQNLLSENNKA